VVVGSTVEDFAFYWNSCRIDECWRVPFLGALWVPEQLTRDNSFLRSLRNWLIWQTYQGSSNRRDAEFMSVSVPKDDLDNICAVMREGPWGIVSRVRPVEQWYQTFRQGLSEARKYRRPIASLNGNNAQRLVAFSEDQTLSLAVPEVADANTFGSWAVDVQIEVESPGYRRADSDWWFLPRRSGRGLAQRMFGGAARINGNWLFSAKIRQDPGLVMRPTRPELKLSLPAESRIVIHLLLRPLELGFEQTEGRISQVRKVSPITDARVSSEGARLRGLIQLFGNFWTAREYCERRFWRETFSKMAGRTAQYDANFESKVKNGLLKEIENEVDTNKAEGLAARLCQRVLALVGERLPGLHVDYAELEAKRKLLAQAQGAGPVVYPAGPAIVHDHRELTLSEQELHDGVDELVRLNVFRPGLTLGCMHCGEKNWFHVDDLRQFVRCLGCGQDLAMSAQPPWHFSLNTLAKRSVSGGALSVLQALAFLAGHGSSFFYSPSLELFRNGNPQTWREIDLACVVNGEFIVGEVKERAFSKKDFERLADVAEVIQPDRAAMFITLERWNANVEQWNEEMKRRLQLQGIVGELYALPSL
jgi:hypothetical protein